MLNCLVGRYKIYAEQVFLYNAEVTYPPPFGHRIWTHDLGSKSFPVFGRGCAKMWSVFKYVELLQRPWYQYKFASVGSSTLTDRLVGIYPKESNEHVSITAFMLVCLMFLWKGLLMVPVVKWFSYAQQLSLNVAWSAHGGAECRWHCKHATTGMCHKFITNVLWAAHSLLFILQYVWVDVKHGHWELLNTFPKVDANHSTC